MIFTPGILVHKYHKTRGDQKSPPRGINFTITLIKKISKPGGMWFPPRGFKFTNFKNPGGPISPPRGPNYTNNTIGRFQNPGDMISTRGINFILFKKLPNFTTRGFKQFKQLISEQPAQTPGTFNISIISVQFYNLAILQPRRVHWLWSRSCTQLV